jgi:hypothetical protein
VIDTGLCRVALQAGWALRWETLVGQRLVVTVSFLR